MRDPEPSLPVRSDVVVIGAGLAGLSVARFLAHRGIAPVLLDRSPEPGAGSASAAGLGVIEVGTPELFSRTVGLLGVEGAAAVHHLSRRNAELIEKLAGDRGGYQRTGSYNLTTEPSELEELKSSARLLRLHAPDVLPWEVIEGTQAVTERTGTEGFIGGVFRPEDAVVGTALFLDLLAQEAISHGASLHRGVEVLAIELDASRGHVVRSTAGEIEAEIVVLAAGSGGVGLNGILRERIVPVLAQGLAFTGLPAGAREVMPPPVSANFGHIQARLAPRDGTTELWAWNIPWSLKGSDPEGRRHTILEDQQRKIESYLAGHFPALRAHPGTRVDRRWAAHTAWTSDSLPLAGPVPGRPRIVLCAGFSGHDWALACCAAQVVAEGIAGEPSREMLDLFSPRRFMSD